MGVVHLDKDERSGHSNLPVPVRYTPGHSRVKTHTLDKEVPSANNKQTTQPVLYHSIGPDTSMQSKGTASHLYTDDPLDHIYQYADTGLNESTTSAAQVRKLK